MFAGAVQWRREGNYKGLHFASSEPLARISRRTHKRAGGAAKLHGGATARVVALALPLVTLSVTGGTPTAIGAPTGASRPVVAGGAKRTSAVQQLTAHLVAAHAGRPEAQGAPGTGAAVARGAKPGQAAPGSLRSGAVVWEPAAPDHFIATAIDAGVPELVLPLPARPPAGHPATDRLGRPGLIAAFGDARSLGWPGRNGPNLVGVAVLPDNAGYWAAEADGAVFAYGQAKTYGSLVDRHPAGGIAAIEATPSGHGYWLVSRHGGVFSFGDAHFYRSLGRSSLSSPVVGMASTPDGRGYWLATASGGVYSFGDAKFFGSLGRGPKRQPVIGIATAPRGNGYWLATAGGGVFSFGGAKFRGSMSSGAGAHVTAIAADRAGPGYWLLAANGSVHGFGAAADFGSARTAAHVIASTIAPTGNGHGYMLATTTAKVAPSAALDGPVGDAVERVTGPALAYLGTFMVTCYDLTGVTASGALAGPQSVAVDPGVIPLGTQLYVDGVGQRTADDTGGAIIGHHIDIWEPSYTQCVDWGVQDRAVYRIG